MNTLVCKLENQRKSKMSLSHMKNLKQILVHISMHYAENTVQFGFSVGLSIFFINAITNK